MKNSKHAVLLLLNNCTVHAVTSIGLKQMHNIVREGKEIKPHKHHIGVL